MEFIHKTNSFKLGPVMLPAVYFADITLTAKIAKSLNTDHKDTGVLAVCLQLENC